MVYYLKGCNFRCPWCGNPEGISPAPEMLFYPARSRFAEENCPFGAVAGTSLKRVQCLTCKTRPCVNKMRDPAFEWAGQDWSLEELTNHAADRRELFQPDGGITFSGGEPTMQMDELLEAARALKKIGMHLAVETNASSPRFAELAGLFDYVIADLKCVTPTTHQRIFEAENQTVLANLKLGIAHLIRIPLAKEITLAGNEPEAIIQYLCEVRPRQVELLRLHALGAPKFAALDLPYPAADVHPPTKEEAAAFALRLQNAGIPVIISQ